MFDLQKNDISVVTAGDLRRSGVRWSNDVSWTTHLSEYLDTTNIVSSSTAVSLQLMDKYGSPKFPILWSS